MNNRGAWPLLFNIDESCASEEKKERKNAKISAGNNKRPPSLG